MSKIPTYSKSYWTEYIDRKEAHSYPQAVKDNETEIVIIGAGIVGVLSAYELAKRGRKVILLEADRILYGTTGHTTAKITAQHGLFYDELIRKSGEEAAKLYYKANMDGLNYIRQVIKEENIDCDFSEQTAYTYAVTDEYDEKIKAEFKAYEKLGIDGELLSELPLPFQIKSAVSMNGQAQFHPLKLLSNLLVSFEQLGGAIYEQSPVKDIEEDDSGLHAILKNGHRISGQKIIIATHYPFYDMLGLYFSRLHPMRSYIVAATVEEEIPDGMYISADQPTRSLRYTDYDGRKLLLIGGESHKTGQSEDELSCYNALESFTKDYFTVDDFPYRWSAQDLVTLDKLPYIGQYSSSKENLFIATGFGKWGMSNGAVASMLLCDLATDQENPYEELFSPSRSETNLQSASTFVKENANVAKELIKGKISPDDVDPNDLKPNEGGHIKFKGKRAGAYRDENGSLCILDTTCTHMGCEVNWNSGERSWDCPCHGSRFDTNGEVLEGPAVDPLKKLN
ncbi:FAD-dependent oxidoreductase [Pradoshia eiseniae]|uniref:FAD-dependent oxidoreductase n=1 Tax=Pradoshia eiseniae TaxID=2064768 RepID=A0A2S7N0Y9_9BACI|nr:FAD-dependent oxidoreductase [Pradoshia eiseniae]PQD95752.1 FAD-dependent oxidoreductase [Pradoshia eiseniae]